MNADIPDVENQITVPDIENQVETPPPEPVSVMRPDPLELPLFYTQVARPEVARQVSEEILWTPDPATLVNAVSRTPPRLARTTNSTTITPEVLDSVATRLF